MKPAPPTHAWADPATPLSLTGTVGEAVAVETVPLLAGRLDETVPFLDTVVCATLIEETGPAPEVQGRGNEVV